MKINLSIPGWNARNALVYLARAVSKLPNDAEILEIGALFGRTTYVLGHNKPHAAGLVTIDPWMTYRLSNFADGETLHDNLCGEESKALIAKYTSANPDRIEGDDFYALWKLFIGEINNHTVVRGYSPITTRNWQMFDFIYHDGPHDEAGVYADLCFWFPKLKPNGSFVLDDYYISQHPELCSAVDRYVSENNLITNMVTERNIELRRKK